MLIKNLNSDGKISRSLSPNLAGRRAVTWDHTEPANADSTAASVLTASERVFQKAETRNLGGRHLGLGFGN